MTLRFEDVFDAHVAYVVRTMKRLGVAPEDAEDQAQNVFVAVYRQLDAFDPSRPLKPWLFGFCFRVASNYRRLARHRYEERKDEAVGHAEGTPMDSLARKEARSLVMQALATLEEEERAVFCMYELDGFTAPEIADALALAPERVYVIVRTARRRFRSAVEAIQGGTAA